MVKYKDEVYTLKDIYIYFSLVCSSYPAIVTRLPDIVCLFAHSLETVTSALETLWNLVFVDYRITSFKRPQRCNLKEKYEMRGNKEKMCNWSLIFIGEAQDWTFNDFNKELFVIGGSDVCIIVFVYL